MFFRAYLSARSGEIDGLDLEAEAEHMVLETDAYVLASHMLWALWALLSVKISEIEFGYMVSELFLVKGWGPWVGGGVGGSQRGEMYGREASWRVGHRKSGRGPGGEGVSLERLRHGARPDRGEGRGEKAWEGRGRLEGKGEHRELWTALKYQLIG